ncbi:uncharacterized protein LOC115439722 [Manduca sexta]|uniref:uncharacterized protein LOC115439722 n=1 Tax=Manduca sexta TaxID=7130 RepID=UPI00188EEA3C|nr:uncharacterized protein LOC115439722 [Manduca sexta]
MAKIAFVFFFIFHSAACDEYSLQYFSNIGEKFELKFYEGVDYLARWLEGFNDRRWGTSELGRLLHYNDIKPKIDNGGRSGKSMKKMSMAMMPLIFHMGASSTWMLLTSIMAAKSVAIGLALLVFKIAVSSAKVASFFTKLKAKHSHPEWSWQPPEYGSTNEEWSAYSPKWNENVITQTEYKPIPLYRNNELESYDKRDRKFNRK